VKINIDIKNRFVLTIEVGIAVDTKQPVLTIEGGIAVDTKQPKSDFKSFKNWLCLIISMFSSDKNKNKIRLYCQTCFCDLSIEHGNRVT
jgi:hypothetical protein